MIKNILAMVGAVVIVYHGHKWYTAHVEQQAIDKIKEARRTVNRADGGDVAE